MKKMMVMVILLAFAGSSLVLAQEGGTKGVVVLGSDRGEIKGNVPPLSSDYGWNATKPVVRFLHRMPEPTLSRQTLREERPGPSKATKSVVLFQKEGRI